MITGPRITTLQLNCEQSWQQPSGPYRCSPMQQWQFMEPSLSFHQFPRLCGFMDALIQSQMPDDQERIDIRVCMAGHGEIDRFGMEALLDRGVSVVSRESGLCQKTVLQRSPLLASAVERKQLVLSDAYKPHPFLPYDIEVWLHPRPLDAIEMGQNLAMGGLLMVQTDYELYSEMDADQYDLIFARSNLSQSNYVFYSGYLDTAKPNFLRIWQKQVV